MKNFSLLFTLIIFCGCASEKVKVSYAWYKSGANDTMLSRDMISAKAYAQKSVPKPNYPILPNLPEYQKTNVQNDFVVVAGDNNVVNQGQSHWVTPLSTEMADRQSIANEREKILRDHKRKISQLDNAYASNISDAVELFLRSKGWEKLKNVSVYYPSGAKKSDSQYVNSRLNYCRVWKPDGTRCPISSVDNGNGIVVEYDEDGFEKFRRTFSNGSTTNF